MKWKNNRPYKNWEKKELEDMLIIHIERMQLDDTLKRFWRSAIVDAFRSKDWEVILDYNGCTLVQDMYHPCPACFLHDYFWISGRGGRMADRIFYHLMIAEGMNKGKALRRWFAVRVGWYSFYMWKYIITRKWNTPTLAMMQLDEYFMLNKLRNGRD